MSLNLNADSAFIFSELCLFIQEYFLEILQRDLRKFHQNVCFVILAGAVPPLSTSSERTFSEITQVNPPGILLVLKSKIPPGFSPRISPRVFLGDLSVIPSYE